MMQVSYQNVLHWDLDLSYLSAADAPPHRQSPGAAGTKGEGMAGNGNPGEFEEIGKKIKGFRNTISLSFFLFVSHSLANSLPVITAEVSPLCMCSFQKAKHFTLTHYEERV